ncbi:hypothetical protein BKG80_18940 [Mycobacteroides chelonae]|nr:tyrosine-type recombinase/integrase [Mycobacteroides chelonae]MBF9349268.1 tyrosine-type recombinase/integrase [Mycobacteroides chelonae]OHU34965.1 hypothetical protein BKG80_18940 [Mycobacteroides chelonae]
MWIGVVDIPTEDGSRKRKTVSSKDKSKALNKLRDLRKDVAEGRVTASPTITVEKWLTQWLETIVEPTVAPSTFESYYEPMVRLHLIPNIGQHRMGKLTPAHVRALMRKLEGEPTPAAKRLLALKRPLTEEEQVKSKQTGTRTAQKAHQVLTKALSDAVKEGALARNVVQVVEKPDHIAEEKEPFSAAEARQILATAFETGDPLFTMWVTLFFTSARQGEAIGLELDRCDTEEGIFHFDWQLQYRPKRKIRPGFEYRDCTAKLIFTPLKSAKSHRHVAMTDPVWKMMKQYLQEKSGPNPHRLVWHRADGSPLSPGDADDAWGNLMERSGVRYRSMHATRHTTNTLLNNARVAQETRMAISGHSTVKAQEGYVHSDIEAQRAALSNLNELLG